MRQDHWIGEEVKGSDRTQILRAARDILDERRLNGNPGTLFLRACLLSLECGLLCPTSIGQAIEASATGTEAGGANDVGRPQFDGAVATCNAEEVGHIAKILIRWQKAGRINADWISEKLNPLLTEACLRAQRSWIAIAKGKIKSPQYGYQSYYLGWEGTIEGSRAGRKGKETRVNGTIGSTSGVGKQFSVEPSDAQLDPFVAFIGCAWPGTIAVPFPRRSAGSALLMLPPGDAIPGAFVHAIVTSSPSSDRRAWASAPVRAADVWPLLPLPNHTLIVTAEMGLGGERQFYGASATSLATRGLAGALETTAQIPHAFVLDDFTFGIAWAICGLDASLLGDDAAFAAAWQQHFRAAESSVRTKLFTAPGDLSPLTALCLGSHVCAQHILREMKAQAETPLFWTKEQTGEQACMWLLVKHKFDYLKRLNRAYRSNPTVRVFCLPRAVVETQTVWQRVLLLLTAGLMESFRIQVVVCPVPSYSQLKGFVLDKGNRAVVADFVRLDRTCVTDVTDRRSTLRELNDAIRFAEDNSAIKANAPSSRLERLADYLSLDWGWLRRRSSAVTDVGLQSFLKPKSRQLSLDGLVTACRFIAQFK